MLPKKERLTKKVFIKVFKEGLFVSSSTLSLRVKKVGIPNTPSQFAVVIPQKIVKHKPEQNRLKRQFFALLQKKKPVIRAGLQAILFLKKEVKELSLKEREQALHELFSSAKLLR